MKKCYNANCLTIFVPKDFHSGSPRRMFCSWRCFEDHWHRKLTFYGQVKIWRFAIADAESDRPVILDSGDFVSVGHKK
jgi:hypothetical protein